MKKSLQISLIFSIILASIVACLVPLRTTSTHLQRKNNFNDFESAYNLIMTNHNNLNDMRKITFNKSELTKLNGEYIISQNEFANKTNTATSSITYTSSSLNFEEHAISLNYKVDETETEFILTKPYAGKRIMLNCPYPVDTKNAIAVARGYKGYQILQYETEQDTKNALEYYQSLPEVSFAVLDTLISTTDDIDYSNYDIDIAPTKLNDKTYYLTWGADVIGADAYNTYLTHVPTNNKRDTYVAVIDSGIDTDHPSLIGRIDYTHARKYTYNSSTSNTSTSDGKTYVEDGLGHGTHVSGIIADLTPENVKIIPIKVIEDNNTGNLYSSILALLYVADLKESAGLNIGVANLSLGTTSQVIVGSDAHSAFTDAIEACRDVDISIVAAAGNSSDDCSNYSPANVANAITVSNMTSTYNKAYSSCYGSYIDLTAPGYRVYSTYNNGDFGYMSGTSMSAPHVSACVALLHVYNYTNNYSIENVENLIIDNAIDLSTDSWDGYGLVNVKDLAKMYTVTLINSTPELGTVKCSYQEGEKTATNEGININILHEKDFIYTVAANENAYLYKINNEIVSDVYTNQENTITLPSIVSNQTVTVEFAVKQFSINVENTLNGTISIDKSVLFYGESSKITIIPNKNYKIKAVFVDDVDMGAINEYTFTNVIENHTVRADFIIKSSSNITLFVVGNGIITDMFNNELNSSFILYEDCIQEFKFIADNNHTISTVKINGVDMGEISYYKLIPQETNYEIIATFEPIIHSIQLNLAQEIKLSTTADLNNVTAGSTVEFKIEIEEGYEIDHILVNGKVHNFEGDTIVIENIQADTTISVSVKEIKEGVDLNFIITVSLIGLGVVVLVVMGFVITKRKKPY